MSNEANEQQRWEKHRNGWTDDYEVWEGSRPVAAGLDEIDADRIVAALNAHIAAPDTAAEAGEWVPLANYKRLLREYNALTARVKELEQACETVMELFGSTDDPYIVRLRTAEARVKELEQALAQEDSGHQDAVTGWNRALARVTKLRQALEAIATWRTTGHDRATFWRAEQIARAALQDDEA